MRLRFYFQILLITVFFLNISCANIFSDMSQKETDKALYYAAQMKIDNRDYTGAITDITTRMSTTYQAQREVKVLLASAYAGRCGLELVSLINSINTGTGGRFFQILLRAFLGSTTSKVNDCISAENTLKTIGSESVRTATENIYMAFVAMAKAGSYLNRDGDLNQDGTADATYLQVAGNCDTDMPTAVANQMVTAVGLLLTSLTAAGTSTAGSTATSVTAICTTLQGTLGAAYNFCNVTDTTNVTSQHRQAIRGLMRENQSVGLGTGAGQGACDGTTVLCVCGT